MLADKDANAFKVLRENEVQLRFLQSSNVIFKYETQ